MSEDDFLDIDDLTALINEDSDDDDGGGDGVDGSSNNGGNKNSDNDNGHNNKNDNDEVNDCNSDAVSTTTTTMMETTMKTTTTSTAVDDDDEISDGDLEDLAALMEEDGDFEEETMGQSGAGKEEEEAAGEERDAGTTEAEAESVSGEAEAEDDGAEAEAESVSEEAEAEDANDESQEELMEELAAMERKMADLKKKLGGAKSGGRNDAKIGARNDAKIGAKSDAKIGAKNDAKIGVKNDAKSGAKSKAPSATSSPATSAGARAAPFSDAPTPPSNAPTPTPPSNSSAPPKKSSFCSYMKGLEDEAGKRQDRRPAPPAKSDAAAAKAAAATKAAAAAALNDKLEKVKAKLNPSSQHSKANETAAKRTPSMSASTAGITPSSASRTTPSTSRTTPSTSRTTPSTSSTASTPTGAQRTPSTSSASPRLSTKDAQMSKELFGDDFDDDDFDDPEDRDANLNAYGAQIRNSLKKEKEKASDLRRERDVDKSAFASRLAAAASAASTAPAASAPAAGSSSKPSLPQPPPSKNTLAAPASRPQSSSSSASSSSSSSSSSVETETLTGLRIRNPRVSVFGLQQKLQSKRLLRLSRLRAAIRNGVIEGEWSTLAVVVAKGETRTSSKGNSFVVWTLSDLDDCDLKVSLFLFGETFKTHWKTVRGSVVGIVNATVMPPREKGGADEIALTVDQPQKLLFVGDSPDLGVCRATKKNGDKCSSFVNAAKGEFCSFHVQKAYHRIGAKRGEFQSAMTGHAPKKFEQARLAKQVLGGNSEFYYGGKTFTSASLPVFNNNNSGALKKRKNDLEKLASLNQLPGGSVDAFKGGIRSDVAAHHNVSARLAAAVTSGLQGGKDFHERMTKPTAGSKTLLAHLVEKEEEERRKEVAPKTAKALLKETTAVKKAASSNTNNDNSNDEEAGPLDVEFNFPSSSSLNPKAAAIAKVKAAGGIKKENPNDVKAVRLKKLADPKRRDELKRRLSSSGGESGADESNAASDGGTGTSSTSSAASAAKRRKIVDLDLNSPEAMRLLKAKSSHAGALADQKAEEEETYFAALEKKEMMAEQMEKITKVKCKVVTCKACKYTAIAASEECRQEHPHQLVYQQGSKGFFSCGKCGKRTVALGVMPEKPCKNCGAMKWSRCSMLKEKRGPTLESEVLLLRGEESGFIGAEGGAGRAMKLLEQKRKGTAIATTEEED